MIEQYTNDVDLEDKLYNMEWAKPFYSSKQVNHAGETLMHGNPNSLEWLSAMDIVDNFRSAHAFPLNTLQINLRSHANTIDNESIIAQRLKRLFSILIKLERFKTMNLWEMQDIGGCRAIMHNVGDVNKLADFYITGSSVLF